MTAPLVANARIAAETFDGEVVLIDVEKGVYFSLQGAAIDVWQAFADARMPATVIDAFAAQVPGSDPDALLQIVAEMQKQDLLVAAPDNTIVDAPPSLATAAFVAPTLDVYTDLAELIAIDPVHEVDAEAGWPLRPANFPDVT